MTGDIYCKIVADNNVYYKRLRTGINGLAIIGTCTSALSNYAVLTPRKLIAILHSITKKTQRRHGLQIIFIFFFTDEIKAVRKLSTEFVQNSNNSVINTAFVYILVPFNDPSKHLGKVKTKERHYRSLDRTGTS